VYVLIKRRIRKEELTSTEVARRQKKSCTKRQIYAVKQDDAMQYFVYNNV
jgi:hypothetical protein